MGMVAVVFMAVCTAILFINMGLTNNPKPED